jgi:hypothetical protein
LRPLAILVDARDLFSAERSVLEPRLSTTVLVAALPHSAASAIIGLGWQISFLIPNASTEGSVSRPSKPKGPRRVDGKLDYPDMLDWAWARAIPATLEVLVGDVSAASVKWVPTLFGIFFASWLTVSDDAALKPLLGLATLVTFSFTVIVLLISARRSRLRPSTAVALHSAALIGVAVVTVMVIASGLYQQVVRSSTRQQEASSQRKEDEAGRAAAAEVKKQAQIAQDAAARAAAAKDEAARSAEDAAARIAEAKCLQARDDLVQKATKEQSRARTAVDDCKTQFNETLITIKTEQEFCKLAYGRLHSARAQLADTTSKSCGTDATGSIERAK